LGNEHPTEKGFRFDWTLGLPVIPASSIKGVVRLAYLVNCLNELLTKEEAEAFAGFLLSGKLPELGQRIFGVGADQEARRGRVIFLDAYPAELPRLKAEIMNCHYPDYYKGDRGPTEDQSPNPQKFWAVDTQGANGQPLQFIFRLLVHNSLANEASNLETLKKALDAALYDHGLGAKTAIGHGRFAPKETVVTSKGDVAPKQPPKPVPQQETWPQANLTWRAQDGTVVASFQRKTATAKGKDLVPEIFRKNLFDKKKAVIATVTVEPIGNAFKIVAIKEAG
jgi:CRISPR-associated protein Cmr6